MERLVGEWQNHIRLRGGLRGGNGFEKGRRCFNEGEMFL